MCDNPSLVTGLLPKVGVFSAATAVSVGLLGQVRPVANTSSGTSLDCQAFELAYTLKLTHTLYTVCKDIFCARLITLIEDNHPQKVRLCPRQLVPCLKGCGLISA